MPEVTIGGQSYSLRYRPRDMRACDQVLQRLTGKGLIPNLVDGNTSVVVIEQALWHGLEDRSSFRSFEDFENALDPGAFYDEYLTAIFEALREGRWLASEEGDGSAQKRPPGD